MPLVGLLFDVLAGVLLVLLLITNLVRPRAFLFLAGFVIPMVTLGAVVGGVNLAWFTMIGPIGLGLLLLSPARADHWRDRGLNSILLYLCVVTGSWMVAEYTWLHRYEMAQAIGLGPAQSTLKMPVQLASLSFQFLAFYVVPSRARSARDASYAAWGVMAGCLISAGVGLALYLATGHGYFGSNDGLGHMRRVGGLSGEPKHLGSFLVIALALIGSLYALGSSRSRLVLAAMFMLFLFALFLTYSTSAWLAFGVAISILIALSVVLGRRSRKGLLLSLLIGLIVAGSQVPLVQEALVERLYARLIATETREIEEQKENYVLDSFRARPLHVVFGFGAGGTDLEAAKYLLADEKYAAQLAYVRTPTPALTGVRLLGDMGIGGVSLLALVAAGWTRRLLRHKRFDLAVFVITGGCAMLLLSMNALTLYLFLCGAAVSAADSNPLPGAGAQPESGRFTVLRSRVGMRA